MSCVTLCLNTDGLLLLSVTVDISGYHSLFNFTLCPNKNQTPIEVAKCSKHLSDLSEILDVRTTEQISRIW